MMDIIKIAELTCPEFHELETTAVSICEVEHLSSYNWIEASVSTIAVPGISDLSSQGQGFSQSLVLIPPSAPYQSCSSITSHKLIEKLIKYYPLMSDLRQQGSPLPSY
ncbi:hypothetical protein BO85DRAFT_453118 [Aspergillus piperis CBS 112811]|uniref:Uncharacterized protein n=1 Tax=Aspergillus piperis CBS 112811 TaxID=1448313 RepID=A0A8G1VHE4_9EURO|nr:hypothetical protein BO85DRAFT_453118 [Aspergillus piperis CBS 112811]RAH53301.1 hypothetical protein BO85DRAFT_453118 [Aspergillus piperis CBS 112811]